MKKFILLIFLFSFCPLAKAAWDSQKVDLTALTSIATSDTFIISTADTIFRLPDVGPIRSALLKSNNANGGVIRWGGSWVKSTSFSLATGDSVVLDVDDLSDIYVRSNVAGDQVEYAALSH